MLRITWEVEGVVVLDRAFARADQAISDLRPYWDNVQREFWKVEDQNFKSQNSKGASGAWKPLTRPYAKQKARRYGVKTILRASDRMYKSLTSKTGDTELFKEKMEFGIGTSVNYAGYHQRGGKNLHKRPVIDFSESQKNTLMKGLQKDILAEMRKTGLEVK